MLIDGENIGIYVSHGGFEGIHASLGGWTGGGIAVDNSSSALILNSYLIQNGKFGILFYEATGVVLDTKILNTHSSSTGLLGDGISVWCRALTCGTSRSRTATAPA